MQENKQAEYTYTHMHRLILRQYLQHQQKNSSLIHREVCVLAHCLPESAEKLISFLCGQTEYSVAMGKPASKLEMHF